MAHDKSCFNVNDIVDIVETGEFDQADVFICLLDKDGGDVLRIVSMKKKEVITNISILFELSFNDFSSWTVAKGEGGYKWAHFSCFTQYCSARAI